MSDRARHLWTTDEIDLLRDLYPASLTTDIAARLGISKGTVYRKAYALGLSKSEEHAATLKAKLRAAMLDKSHPGRRTQFQQGMTTWNKGMKGLQMGGKETQFKKGQTPHNTLEVGEYRVNRDGMLQRKIGTAKGSNSKRWRGVHELVWVEANGPVPAGHICVFRPGMRTVELAAITADKVECITFAENMRRNTLHKYPKDVVQAIQLRGALNRKINRIERTRNERDHC